MITYITSLYYIYIYIYIYMYMYILIHVYIYIYKLQLLGYSVDYNQYYNLIVEAYKLTLECKSYH